MVYNRCEKKSHEVIYMLKEFTVSNFKSIDDTIVFSMEADYDRVSEFPEHIVDINDNKILKVTSMYGPNGGGKTNVLSALSLAKVVVTSGETILIRPLRFDCAFSDKKSIEETLFFVDEEYEYGYQFKININVEERQETEFSKNHGNNLYSVVEIINESVSYRKNGEDDFLPLIERSENGNITFKNQDNLVKDIQLAKNNSVITFIYKTYANNESNVEELNVVKGLYRQITSITNLNEPIYLTESDLSFIEKNKEKLISLLNSADIKICDIIVSPDRYNQVLFVRKLLLSDKEITTEISLRAESSGTVKTFFIFVDLLKSISSTSRIFYCNDMNAYLHPKLYRAIIELFNSEANKSSQLIFNTHDILNMSNNLFRRDEIWFVYRDEKYSTQVVSLANIVNYKGEQIRKDAKYYKQYLEGKFGADPFIKKGLNWEELVDDENS